jgi:hypothetical protein
MKIFESVGVSSFTLFFSNSNFIEKVFVGFSVEANPQTETSMLMELSYNE